MKCVFRSDGDSEEKRLCDTPLPNVILSKLDTFTINGKTVLDDKGINLFRDQLIQARYALKNIKRHISAGCLSGIPPPYLLEEGQIETRAFFNRSCIGILLAYALLTMICDRLWEKGQT